MATLPTAEGGIALTEEHLAITLADSARFQEWCGAGSRAAALQRIYIDGLPKPADDRDTYTKDELVGLRPFAIIALAGQSGYSKGRVATETYVEAGRLHIAFEENVPDNLAGDIAVLSRTFKNTLGVIMDELLALAYTAPDADSQYLAIDGITFHGPMRCLQTDVVGEGDHHFAIFDLQFGVGVR